MTAETVIGGQLVRSVGPVPSRHETGRVRSIEECVTRLSSYNRHDTCFRHAPVRHPRVRGRVRTTTKPSPGPSANARRARS